MGLPRLLCGDHRQAKAPRKVRWEVAAISRRDNMVIQTGKSAVETMRSGGIIDTFKGNVVGFADRLM